MKKLILALSLAAALLFSTTSCDIDINITVNAHADLYDLGSEVPIRTETIGFGPFSHTYLSEAEVDVIFRNLIQNSTKNFTTADLFLLYVDNIMGAELKMEHYGVVVQGDGRFEYMLMDEQ